MRGGHDGARRRRFPDAPHEHRDVSALSTAIGMKLVENQKIQAFAILDYLLISLTLPHAIR